MAGPVDPQEIKYSLADFLHRQHFDVDIDEQMLSGQPVVVVGKSNDCRLLIAETWPLGDPVDSIQQLTTDGDHSFIVFRGEIYDKQPLARSVTSYLWYTFLCRLGLASRIPRVLAVITSCNAEKLPWIELQSI